MLALLVSTAVLVGTGCSTVGDIDRVGLSGDELQIGDCLNAPPAGDVGYVYLSRCDEPHDAEVFAVVALEPINQPFPGDVALQARASSACLELLAGYATPSPDLGFTFLLPTDSSWDIGIRTAPCLAIDLRGRVLESTIALGED